MKANHIERANVVKAMETMVRCINDETVFFRWLSNGVADEDIKEDTSLQNVVDLGYTEDKQFKELLDLFIRLMYKARLEGLYCDGIVSNTLQREWK